MLKALHPDLMTAEYWREVQAITARGKKQSFTPYNSAMRFRGPKHFY